MSDLAKLRRAVARARNQGLSDTRLDTLYSIMDKLKLARALYYQMLEIPASDEEPGPTRGRMWNAEVRPLVDTANLIGVPLGMPEIATPLSLYNSRDAAQLSVDRLWNAAAWAARETGFSVPSRWEAPQPRSIPRPQVPQVVEDQRRARPCPPRNEALLDRNQWAVEYACDYKCPDLTYSEWHDRGRDWTLPEWRARYKDCSMPCPNGVTAAHDAAEWARLYGTCGRLLPCPSRNPVLFDRDFAVETFGGRAKTEGAFAVVALNVQEWAQLFGSSCGYREVGTYVHDAAIPLTAPPPPPKKKKDDAFDKAKKTLRRTTKFLDETLPGWQVLLDVLTPALPILPLLTMFLGRTAGLLAATTVGTSKLAYDALNSVAPMIANEPFVRSATQAPMAAQERVVRLAQETLRVVDYVDRSTGGNVLDAAEKWKFTLAKAADDLDDDAGTLEQRLLKVMEEVAAGAALVVALAAAAMAGPFVALCRAATIGASVAASQAKSKEAAFAASGAGMACSFFGGGPLDALQKEALGTLKDLTLGLRVATELVRLRVIQQAARDLRRNAEAQAAVVGVEVARLDAETVKVEEEVARLRKRRALVEAWLRWLKSRKLARRPMPASWKPPAGLYEEPDFSDLSVGPSFLRRMAKPALVLGGIGLAAWGASKLFGSQK